MLATFRKKGAVLLHDLMTPADASELGWQASFTDLLALVEQEILARADYFVGSGMSSTSGGVVNMREASKMPSWTWAFA